MAAPVWEYSIEGSAVIQASYQNGFWMSIMHGTVRPNDLKTEFQFQRKIEDDDKASRARFRIGYGQFAGG